MRTPLRKPKVSKITIPQRCHALAKVIFAEMQRQCVSYDELEYRSGVLKSTFKAWRTNNRPGLETIEATLGSLGWALLPVPTMSQLPASIRDKLEVLAAEWGEINPLLCELIGRVSGVEIASAEKLQASEAVNLTRRLQAEGEQNAAALRSAEKAVALAAREAIYVGKQHAAEVDTLKANIVRLSAELENLRTRVQPRLEARITHLSRARKLSGPITDADELKSFYNWRFRQRSKKVDAHV